MPAPETPSPTATAPLLCVVIPVFNEEPVLPELLKRLQRVAGTHAASLRLLVRHTLSGIPFFRITRCE
jgi:hypothetical protein